MITTTGWKGKEGSDCAVQVSDCAVQVFDHASITAFHSASVELE